MDDYIDAYVVYRFKYREKDKTCRSEEVLFVVGREDMATNKIEEIAQFYRQLNYTETKLPKGIAFSDDEESIELVYRKGHVEF